MNALKKLLPDKFKKNQNKEEEINAERNEREKEVRKCLQQKNSNRDLRTPVYSLANEIFDLIFSFLEPLDLAVCEQVSKLWQSLANQELFWKKFCCRDGIESLAEETTWKKEYWRTFGDVRKYISFYRKHENIPSLIKMMKGIPMRIDEMKKYEETVLRPQNHNIHTLGLKVEPVCFYSSTGEFKTAFTFTNSTNKEFSLKYLLETGHKDTIRFNAKALSSKENRNEVVGTLSTPGTCYRMKIQVSNNNKRVVCEFEVVIYFHPKPTSIATLELFKIEQQLSATTFLGTYLGKKTIARIADSYEIKGCNHREHDCLPAFYGSTKGCSIEMYFTEYMKGKNLFQVIDGLSLMDKFNIATQLIALGPLIGNDSNTNICPQNVIIDKEAPNIKVRLSIKDVHHIHKFNKLNIAFSSPNSLYDEQEGIFYCIGNIIYFLFSKVVPYSFGEYEKYSTEELNQLINKSKTDRPKPKSLFATFEELSMRSDSNALPFAEFPPGLPNEVADLVMQLWNHRPPNQYKKELQSIYNLLKKLNSEKK